VPAGALLVLTTTADAVVSDCSVSSSPALTWTKRVDAGATSSDNAEIWTAVYTAGGSITVTSNWGAESQASVCYVVLNAEPTLSGAFGTGHFAIGSFCHGYYYKRLTVLFLDVQQTGKQ
jgi:uncharacterized protein YjdB